MMSELYRSAPPTLKLNAQAGSYLTFLLVAALLLQVVQIGLINTELSTIRLALAGTNLAMLTLATLMRVGERSFHASVSILFALTMLTGWAISIFLLDGAVNWNVIGIQLAFPIYLGAMGSQDSRTLLRWVTLVSTGTVLYAAVYAVINPTVIIDMVPRAQGFLENRAPHNSAFMIGSIFIFFYIAGVRQGRVPKWMWVPVLLVSAALLYFYKVRTAQVMVLGFFCTLAVPYLKKRFGIGPLIAIFFLLAFFAASYVTSNSTLDLTTFSSGRTSVYVERLALVAERSLIEIVLGSGPGSDSFYSDAWWWDAKNSHNDFLTTLIERGLLGFVSLIVYIFAFCHARRLETIAIVTAVVLTGLFSNGLFQRPLPLLFCTFAIWVSAVGRPVHSRTTSSM